MPAQSTGKRVKGVSIFRPFVFGSTAKPFDPAKKPANVTPGHTHQWTVYVRGIDDEDISYWLKKVQFKLHETYENSSRMVEGPPFEVTETGWGEFDIQLKLFFVPESHEKAAATWHTLKLHPYGPDAERQREERATIESKNYEEVVFNEPFENWYEILTGGAEKALKAKGKGKGGAKGAVGKNMTRDAELPEHPTASNAYSREVEKKELEKLKAAIVEVEKMTADERKKLTEADEKLVSLRGPDPVLPVKKR